MPPTAYELSQKVEGVRSKLVKALADQDKEFKGKDRSKLDAGQQERFVNLEVGISRLHDELKAVTEEWTGAVLEGVADGSIGTEGGSEPGSNGNDLELRRAGVKDEGFAAAVLRSGFNLKQKPSVTFSGMAALGFKANSFPVVTSWDAPQPEIVPSGYDTRWLYPNLVRSDAGTATVIQDFKQSARTLTGTVKRALDATSTKANVDVTLALVTEALSQFAVTINDIPNALLESVRMIRSFLSNEGRFQVEKAIDAHVFAQIVAAAPPFGNTGTGLIEQVRNGISAMRVEGANPDILVLNATDAAALDLSTSGTGTPYLFATRTAGASSPLWGLTVVERTSAAGNEPPYLIDRKMLGVLYIGSMRFDADPFTGFKANLTTVRIETKALFHVRDAKGARRIAAT